MAKNTSVDALPPPEIMLERLVTALQRATVISAQLTAGAEGAAVRGRMREAMRQLAIRRLLWNTRAIAVTGLQGAGKTTFTLNLLGNSPELQKYLPTSHLRDEKVSILIREHAGPGIKAGVVSFASGQDGFVVVETEISTAAEFEERARAPHRDDMLLTLRVPRALFQDDEQAILLTPGIEDTKDKWAAAARQSIFACERVVFVVTTTQMADGSIKLVEEIRREFTSCPMLPVVTHCDDPDGDYSAALATAAELFLVHDAKQDIVQFGVYPPGASWVSQHQLGTLRLLSRQTGTPRAYRARQAEKIRELLEEGSDIAMALTELEALSADALSKIQGQTRFEKEWIRHFSEGREKARKALAKELDRSLSEVHSTVVRDLETQIQNRGGWDKFKTYVFGFDLKDKHYIEDVVSGAWAHAKPGVQVAKVLTSVGDKGIQTYLESGGREKQLTLESLPFRPLLGFDGETTGSTREQDASALVASQKPDASYELALKMTPYWSMAWMGGASQLTVVRGQLAGTPRTEINQQFFTDTAQTIQKGSQFGRQLVGSVLGTVVAADLVDGSPTAITAALKAAGVTVTPLITGVLAAGAAAAALGIVAVSVKRQLASQDLAFADQGRQLANATEDAIKQGVLDNYDAAMDMLEVRLIEYVRNRMHYSEHFDAATRTAFAARDAEQARKHMLGAAEELGAALAG